MTTIFAPIRTTASLAGHGAALSLSAHLGSIFFSFGPSRAKKNQQALNPAGFSDLDFSRPVQFFDPSRSSIDGASVHALVCVCTSSFEFMKKIMAKRIMICGAMHTNQWTHSFAYHALRINH